MGSPPPPPGPPPNPGAGQLLGTNQLGGQLDALTRAFTTFTHRFASQAGLGSLGRMAYGPMGGQARREDQLGRLQQQYTQAQGTHNSARQRMQDDLERQQLQWDRQLRTGTRAMNNYQLPAWQRQEAHLQLGEQGILFHNAQRQTRDQWTLRDSAFSSSVAQMNTDMARLRAQAQQQKTMNQLATAGHAAGAIVGAARAYYSGGFEAQLGQFERRQSLANPEWGGTAGTRARSLGREMKQHGSLMWASSTEDAFGGATDILQQNPYSGYATQSRRAASAAFITPGLGIQGAAQMQQELGTAQAYYASQKFGLAPTRFGNGQQNSSTAMALSLAQRVNAGNFGSLSSSQLHSQLAQNGSLSMSMANYARSAGLSGQTVEGMRNQTELLRNLMNPAKGDLKKLSQDQALQTIESAGRRDAEGERAREEIKKYAPSVGDSYQDSQRYLQGLSREGHLPASASFLDAAKASANTLADIKTILQKTLEPFAKGIGTVTGGFKGGGAVGGSWNLLKSIGGGISEIGQATVKPWDALMSTILGGDSGTPESKQGGSRAKSHKADAPAGGGVAGAISFARAQVGDRYILGANGPNAWDCSSLMQQAFEKAGVKLPRVTYDQIHKGVEVPIDEVKPGDLVFYKDLSHVGLYSGDGKVIEAANPGKGVIEGPMYGKFVRARRVLSGGVEAKASLSGTQEDPTSDQAGGAAGGFSASGAYGSVEEVDALAAVLSGSGGGGSVQSVSRTPSASQNEEAAAASSGGGGKDAVSDTRANVKLGRTMAADFGWTGGQFDALYKLWMRESNWNHRADNPNSDAYGIPQAMSNIHKETDNAAWRNSPSKQIAWGLNYIKRRYATPQKAWTHWQARVPLGGKDVGHWYAAGAWEIPGDQDARLHQGEMVLSRNDAHTVRQALLNQGLNPSPGEGSSSTGGTRGAVTLQFGAGSVVVQMPNATAEGAKSAANSFVSHVAADDRIKSLMEGW
ncbi:C40 family peptidase [Streptomyces sp. NPDC056500]|uniref:C40 family peptidase n=1 Tax=Streptomyces sp. NPDC056500 TaxID=3345840 RepID=UPI0036902354